MNTNRAVFLDRDGVINVKRENYVKSWEEFEFTKDIHEALKLLIEQKFKIIIVTNQSVINRGIITIEELEDIHLIIQQNLKEKHCSIDKFYFCPHRPDENCSCRKPKPEMILTAAKDFEIDLKKSYFIGDSEKDFHAAKNAGCTGILLNENQSLHDCILELFN